MIPNLATLAVAFLISLLLTPLVRWLATKCNLVDRPEPNRKLHQRPVPLGGGLAILTATVLSIGLVMIWSNKFSTAIRHSSSSFVGLLAAALILCVVGLADDRFTLRGRQKLAGYVLAVGVLIYSGLVIRDIHFLNWQIQLGVLAIPFTMFWLLGAINSLNLLDGADGFATTIGIVISGTIAGMAAMQGNIVEAAIASAVMGALIGFLSFNFPPASIFLGDAGSTLIGLAVGALAIRCSLKGPATVALAAPLAVLAIPIFDSAAALVRRVFTGRSLYVGDRGHLHHNLLRGGFGPRSILVGVALLCAVTSGGALLSLYMKNDIFAMGSAFCVVAVLVISRCFGFHELILVANRTLAFGSSLLTSTNRNDQLVRQESVRLQGSRNWDELWNTLTDFAERYELSQVRLDLNVAWLHEGYHAVWERNENRDQEDTWMTRMPLSANGRSIGRLELTGQVSRGPMNLVLATMAEMLESLEPSIVALATELPRDELDECQQLLDKNKAILDKNKATNNQRKLRPDVVLSRTNNPDHKLTAPN